MSQASLLAQSLHAKGLRMTHQRQLILEVLSSSQEHLDAEALHDRVKLRDPRISLATIYRTLSLLKEFEMVQEHHLGEGHGHFETSQDVPHYHFTCQGCGLVIEFEAPPIGEVIDSLIEQEGIQVIETHFHIKGYCLKCQKFLSGADV